MQNFPQLQDIHLPTSPSFWPLAMGWWVLLGLVLFFLVWGFLILQRQVKRKKQQQQILAKLSVLEKTLEKNPSNKVIADINVLLRQLAIHYYPRKQIASLTGHDWLQFLDQSGNTSGFLKGAGRILIEAPYQATIQNFNKDEFFPLVRRWIKNITKNQGGLNE